MAIVNNWYGSIPDSWTVVSFNQSVKRMATGLNPRENFVLSKTDEFYYVTIRNFKDNQLFLDDNCDRISKQAWEIIQARSDLRKGDIIFASISKDGQAYLLDSEPDNWNINESVFCIRVDEKLFNNRYFRYEITNIGFYNDLLLDATGTTFKSIKQNKLRQSKLIAPPLTEQQAIASYLDDRCSKLDEIITEAEKSIEEYKELKQAVITEAVTNGFGRDLVFNERVNLSCPMGWSVCRIKDVAFVQRGGSPRPIEQFLTNANDGLNWIKIGDTVKGYKYIDYVGQKIIKEGLSKTRFVKSGTLLLTNSMSFGEPYILRVDGCIHDGWVALTCSELVDKEFLYYFLCSDFCKTQFKLSVAGSIVQNLNIDKIGSTYVLLPSIDEQQDIVKYLDRKTEDMNALISEKQALVEDLQAYKKSLIYEVVTGKRRVV